LKARSRDSTRTNRANLDSAATHALLVVEHDLFRKNGQKSGTMKRILGKGPLAVFERVLLFAAGCLALIGDQLSIRVLLDLALLPAGVLVILVGGEQIVSRLGIYRVGVSNYAQVVELYRGIMDQLWGVLFLGAGVVMVLVTAIKWLAPTQADSFWSNLAAAPFALGLILGIVGLMTALHGVIRILAGSSGSDVGRITGISDVLDRLLGGATFLLGLGMGFVGITLLVAPGIWKSIFDQLASMILRP
jgi:hypothetical protein